MKKYLRFLLLGIGVIILTCLTSLFVCNQMIVNNAKGKTFYEIDSITPSDYGLLLGTTPQTRIGRRTNYFFKYRIDATERLYKAGKIKRILISGDENSLDGVNEVECMKDSLIAHGVDVNDIILDGKGYRTLDAVVRAVNIYNIHSFVVISQRFHNERAIYLTEHLGLEVHDIKGYNAADPTSKMALMTYIREYFARVKVFVDIFTGKEPATYEKEETKSKSVYNDIPEDTCFVHGLNDSIFTVIYRQPVNGYKVKAIAKLASSDVDVIAADLIFTKNGKSFLLHTQCLGDTVFSKGRLDYHEENPEIFRRLRGKTILADYHEYKEKDRLMPMYTPFFFRDLDFDGVKELVIVHHSMGVRYHDGYDIYRIVEEKPVLINYPPYNDNVEDWGFGMTDYPEIDFNKKTISCPYPEGPGGLPYEGRIIYGISKKQKDIVTVNGRKHYFNQMEVIKEIKYDHGE